MPKGMAKSIENIRGVSNYVARIGAHSGGAAGVFWVDVVKRDKKYVLVSNRWDAGRNKYDPVTMSVETELVRPLVRGRDVQRWTVNPSLSIIIPYAATNFGKAISETKMKMEFPKAFEYFNTFKSPMLERPHYLQHFKPSGAPYWSMYNVGNYTFAHSRVVWREQTSSFQCAVIDSDPELAPVADAKLIVVACGSSDEAHYLAALLNSSPARFVINSYVVKVQISTHVLKNIAVPTFLADNPLHIALAEQSRLCHAAVRQGKIENLSKLEQENDLLAAKLWKLTLGELEQVQSCVSFTENDDAGSDDE